jgi:23S rRNA pseudouridine1911/1915/1917 synthase
MNRTIVYEMEEKEAGQTVYRFLQKKGYSDQNLVDLKKNSHGILVNENPARQKDILLPGDRLTVFIEEKGWSTGIVPVKLPLDIVYEDEDLLVVNKSAGMPVHPSRKNVDNTLGNALLYYFKEQDKPFVYRCINRLDRDTSGLTIVAKHSVSAAILGSMLAEKSNLAAAAERTISGVDTTGSHKEERRRAALFHAVPMEKEYLAIVRGRVTPAAGTITAPIARKEACNLERMIDFEHGEAAVTHYRVVQEKNDHSLVALRLETGRTHQIRIHMKYLGFPLIGDYLYNPDMERIGRQALHASRLSFMHPMTGEKIEITAPLPEDMRAVLEGQEV